jgi:hypothetical protein
MSYKTNRRTRGKFRVIKITDPIDKRLDFFLRRNETSNVRPIDRKEGNAFALVGFSVDESGYAQEEQYSANPHDYFMSKDDHIFEASDGNEMDLAWMGYDDEGNYKIFAIIQEHPITVADLRRLPVK